MNKNSTFRSISIIILLIIVVASGLYFAAQQGYLHKLIELIEDDIPPLLFLILWLLLPAIGFPISVFLLICGIKFGVSIGILLWLLILPLHTLIGYGVAKKFSPFIRKFIKNRLRYDVPAVPAASEAVFSFLFLAIPGIPYAGKNYLLPLTGVSFRYCVVMNSLVQGFLGLPFIILGKSSAEMNPILMIAAIIFLFLLIIISRFLKNKYLNN